MGNGGNVEGEVLGGWSAGVGAGAVWTLVCGLEQAGRHASRIEMMQDGNKSRSKCGVMLALGGCCASDRLYAALRCAGDESSVGRSVDSLFWRAGVIRLFPPLALSPYAAGAASEGKTSLPVSVGCTVACCCRGAGRLTLFLLQARATRDRHRVGCTIVPPDIAVRTEIYSTTARTVPNTWIWIPAQVLGHLVGWSSNN